MITPRLTDEDIDPIEANDGDGLDSIVAGDGWLPWDKDDLIDIYRVIFERLPEKEKQVIMAFLAGQNNKDIDVSEKFFRYHLHQAIKMIKKELDV